MSAETFSITFLVKYVWVPVVGWLINRNYQIEKELKEIRKDTLTKDETRQLLMDVINPVKEDMREVKEDGKETRKAIQTLLTRRRVDRDELD